MRKINVLIISILLFSCTQHKYEKIGQEVINGKVSATKSGKTASYGSPAFLPKIWVQTPTDTREVEIPFQYEGRWKVGDSCLLIIEKYKEIKYEK